MTNGITSYGTYVPRWRLDLAEVAAASGARGNGTRVVASFDEDSTTLGVAASFAALREGDRPSAIWFATTAPAYVDKTNATTVHAALSLPADVAAYDLGASTRSAAAALLTASRTAGLAVLSDIRTGAPGGADEKGGADAAAAFVFGDEGVVAELLGSGSATAEFLDRWANPGDVGSRTWEERFGEGEYLPLCERAVDDALQASGTTIADIDAVVVAGPNTRAAKSAAAALRTQAGVTAAEALPIGNAGAAALGLGLADALDTAGPNQLILAVGLADGADALVLRTTGELANRRGTPVREQFGEPMTIGYPAYLMWRGLLDREPPRRPDPMRPSAPFAARNVAYKFGFQGGRCGECGTVQFPLPPVCLRCHARNSCEPVAGACATGTITTFTVDRLAFSPSPPLVSAVVDLHAGGRVTVEVTDIPVDDLAVGLEVRTTFRRLVTVDGVHNYFWKAGPR